MQLSTDTSGKVSADQIAKLLASKVDKTDLTSQLQAITDSIGTKANSANVTAELAKKDDTADVDAKIKTVTDLANTKANSVDVTAALDKKDDTSDVDAKIKVVTDLTNTKANANDVYNRSTVDNAFTEVRGRLSKLEGTQTLDSPDFNGITASGIYYITNNNGANIKNNPVDQWGVLIVSNGNGHRVSQVYYPDDGNPPWYRSLDESTWRSWYQLSTRYDVNNAVSNGLLINRRSTWTEICFQHLVVLLAGLVCKQMERKMFCGQSELKDRAQLSILAILMLVFCLAVMILKPLYLSVSKVIRQESLVVTTTMFGMKILLGSQM